MSNLNIGMTVLVVDDMMTMRKLVIKSLKEMGFTSFLEAQDGAIGWQQLTNPENKVGLIVSDWNIPNCTGSEKEQIVEALKSGLSGYVIKPFDTDVLKGKIIEAQSVGKKVA